MKNNIKIIKKLKGGDRDTFKELYFSYYSKLMGFGRRFNFEFLTPEDFIHETFLKLHENRHKLKAEILIDKQIFVICKNIILNHIKKEKKTISLESAHFDYLLNEEENNKISEPQKQIQLNNLIEQLPKRQREVFKLHKISNYTYDEISQITNLSQKTIANHIYLANKFLLEKVKK